MSKPKIIISLFALTLLVITSCADKLPPGYEQIGICFETEILPIFVSNCAMSGCHNSTDKADGYDLTNYDGIMTGITAFNASDSKHIQYMERTDDERMPVPPQAPVDAASIALIKAWINKGAPNTVDCQANNCDSISNVSYSNTVLPIINANCLGCHGANGGGGHNYSTYGGIKASADNGSLLGSINHQSPYAPMPVNGKLSNCDIKKIEVWINEGAAQN